MPRKKSPATGGDTPKSKPGRKSKSESFVAGIVEMPYGELKRLPQRLMDADPDVAEFLCNRLAEAVAAGPASGGTAPRRQPTLKMDGEELGVPAPPVTPRPSPLPSPPHAVIPPPSAKPNA